MVIYWWTSFCGIPVGDNKGCAKWWNVYIYIWRGFFINERWKGSNISIHIKILFTARIFLYLHRACILDVYICSSHHHYTYILNNTIIDE